MINVCGVCAVASQVLLTIVDHRRVLTESACVGFIRRHFEMWVTFLRDAFSIFRRIVNDRSVWCSCCRVLCFAYHCWSSASFDWKFLRRTNLRTLGNVDNFPSRCVSVFCSIMTKNWMRCLCCRVPCVAYHCGSVASFAWKLLRRTNLPTSICVGDFWMRAIASDEFADIAKCG